MAQKVAIVTDSVACLTKELVARYGIRILPINFYLDGQIYKDWVDITPSEAYELFLKDPESFKTSAVSPEDCLEAYRQTGKQAKDILCITLSTKLSAVYNVARQTKEQAEAELPGVKLEVFDSGTVTAAEGWVVLAAARAAQEGKSLAEVIRAAEAIGERVGMIMLLDTIRHVFRSGRIPKVAALAGSMLNIRPILTVSSGAVRFLTAVRSREHGIDRILQMMKDKVGQSPVHIAVMHAYASDEAERLRQRVSAEFNCVELWLTELSPIIGYACGTGALGLAYYAEDQGE
ncbi:MAG: DegV family protein [Dehalococcoidia bacterium]|nr:MAG: DegV family protein [Dehalococcoidia bacterium]